MVERRQLEYFLAVVEHGGFTNAARVLHVAQPSLSPCPPARACPHGCRCLPVRARRS
jgi:hypothetical protein